MNPNPHVAEFNADVAVALAVAGSLVTARDNARQLQEEIDRLLSIFASMEADLNAEEIRKSRRGGMGGGLMNETANFPPSAVTYIRANCRAAREKS